MSTATFQKTDRSAKSDKNGKAPHGGKAFKNGKAPRAAEPRKPARTASTEAVIDRGTLDRDGEQVSWTIAKRTVSDLDTRKPVSVVYVLTEGDKADQHPSLAAARAVVGKTIRHPEPPAKAPPAKSGKR